MLGQLIDAVKSLPQRHRRGHPLKITLDGIEAQLKGLEDSVENDLDLRPFGEIPPNMGWICPQCGRANSPLMLVCDHIITTGWTVTTWTEKSK